MQDAASRLERAESLLVGKILHSEAPQGWEWHGKFYVGAAHGLAGVLLGLLRLPLRYHNDTALMQTIKNKVQLLLTDCKYEPPHILYSNANPCRNFKSSVGSQSDRLVQWCHGAPGVLPVLVELIKHPEILENGNVLHEIQNAVLVVQQRGLLRKGLGLCHGIAGNMYTLLEAQARSPSRISEETIQSYLLCMLNYTTLRDNGIMGVGDAEFSLFEGQAGALVCLVDYLESLTGGLCEGFPFYSDC
eukprot:gene26168-31598_t